MTELRKLLTYEEALEHIMAIEGGLHETDILNWLNECARSGCLHLKGNDASCGGVPHVFALQGEIQTSFSSRLWPGRS